MLLGVHVIKSWATTQAVVATSSGEAEYYALTKCGSQSLGLQSMMGDLGLDVGITLKTDASAALGIGLRRGLGKLRHVEVHQLWLQDAIYRGKLALEKVDGKTNPADALTKAVGADMLNILLQGSSTNLSRGRHRLNPQLEEG